MVKVGKGWAFAALLAGIPWAGAHANSVDCQKPSTKIDRMVCGSQPLLNLDTKYAQAYRAARDSAEDRDQFMKLAASDLKWRAENCSDAICVEEWYENVTPRYLAFAANAKMGSVGASGGQPSPRGNNGAPTSKAANDPAFTPQVRQLTQQYARAVGQCELHGASTAVGQEACPRVDEYAKKLKAAGWEPSTATERLFDGCNRFGTAYHLAAITRDNRQPPETALRTLKAEKWLRIEEPGLKSIINTVYFQDWAIRLLPLELTHAVEADCRYGPDPKWKPLK